MFSKQYCDKFSRAMLVSKDKSYWLRDLANTLSNKGDANIQDKKQTRTKIVVATTAFLG